MKQQNLFPEPLSRYAPDRRNQPESAPDEGARLKQRGMALAAQRRQVWLSRARYVARQWARNTASRTCDAAMVRELLDRERYEYEPGPWMGSIFTSRDWEPTGQWRAVDHASGHRRMVRVWRLR